MTGKAIAGLVTALLVIVVAGVAATSFGAASTALAACALPADISSPQLPPRAAQPVGVWDAEQVGNAGTIVDVGRALNVPPRGWIIAVATAMTESSLRNLGHQGDANDHDSLGLFQQRPSQGWGTPDEIMDPRRSAAQFYQHLLAVPGWHDMPLSQAAQSVQRSALPDAYADFEDDAIAVVKSVASPEDPEQSEDFTAWLGMCAALGSDGLPSSASEQLPAGFVLPYGRTKPAVVTALNWALRQLGTPYTYGGDCTDAHSGRPSRQCDCSSLVQQAYRAAGISLPRTTSEQVHAGSVITDFSQLLPGDLLLIPGSDGTPTRPRHVGLYLGAGYLIQAPHSGDVVKISKESDWHRQLAQVRRIV